MAPRANNKYTVGWIAALPLEKAAASAMLDDRHGKPQEQHPKDNNNYSLGSIGEHNVVIACLPSYGTTSAAVVADHMIFSFPSVRFVLMVGIGGEILSKPDVEALLIEYYLGSMSDVWDITDSLLLHLKSLFLVLGRIDAFEADGDGLAMINLMQELLALAEKHGPKIKILITTEQPLLRRFEQD
jgi:hypothetical protein